MGTTARRCAVAVVVAFAAAVIAGCASDETVTSTATTTPVTASSGTSETTEAPPGTDPGDGEYAEACALIDEIDQTAEDDLASALVLFEEARDAGPEELVDHWDTLTDTLTQIEAQLQLQAGHGRAGLLRVLKHHTLGNGAGCAQCERCKEA